MNDLLTPAGERRREQILVDAIRVARRRRTNRLATRVAGTTLAIAAVVWLAIRPTPERPPTPIASIQPTTRTMSPIPIVLAKPPRSPIDVVRIGNEPRPPTAITVERLDDATLLKTLASAGRPAGLATIGGRQILLTDDGPLSSASP